MLTKTPWAALLVAALIGLGGCDINEGPDEELGENIDEAAEEFEDAVEDATN